MPATLQVEFTLTDRFRTTVSETVRRVLGEDDPALGRRMRDGGMAPDVSCGQLHSQHDPGEHDSRTPQTFARTAAPHPAA